jgi:hypothetical protein
LVPSDGVLVVVPSVCSGGGALWWLSTRAASGNHVSSY